MLSFFTILPCYHRQQGGVSPFGEAETLLSLYYLMYQFTYTVPFGIVASETIFSNYSLVNEDTYISFFYALNGGASALLLLKSEKSKTSNARAQVQVQQVHFFSQLLREDQAAQV